MPRPRRQSSTVSTTSMPAIEQHPADGLRDDLAEEVGHRRDVAVDALDQLAGRVAAVELVVEAEHVAGHAQAQLVRRAPRRDRGEADDDDGDDLRGDGDGEEQPGRGGRTSPCRRRRWPRRRSRRTTSGPASVSAELTAQERAEDGPTPSVGPQQGDQGAPARRGRFRHGSSLPPRPFGRAGWVSHTLGAWKPTPRRSVADDATDVEERRPRRGGAARRGDLDRRDVRRLLTPHARCSTAGWRSTRRSPCGPSRSARSPTTTATGG